MLFLVALHACWTQQKWTQHVPQTLLSLLVLLLVLLRREQRQGVGLGFPRLLTVLARCCHSV